MSEEGGCEGVFFKPSSSLLIIPSKSTSTSSAIVVGIRWSTGALSLSHTHTWVGGDGCTF